MLFDADNKSILLKTSPTVTVDYMQTLKRIVCAKEAGFKKWCITMQPSAELFCCQRWGAKSKLCRCQHEKTAVGCLSSEWTKIHKTFSVKGKLSTSHESALLASAWLVEAEQVGAQRPVPVCPYLCVRVCVCVWMCVTCHPANWPSNDIARSLGCGDTHKPRTAQCTRLPLIGPHQAITVVSWGWGGGGVAS